MSGRPETIPKEKPDEGWPPVYERDGEWYFVSETYHDEDGRLIEGSDELQGPFATKEEAQAAGARWEP